MSYERNLRSAFDNIYDHSPMFSGFIMEWEVIPTREVPYAATNGPQLFINPDFMDTLNIAETLKVVKHEAGHVFLGHMWREPLEALNDPIAHHEWNVAFDLALNDLIATHDHDFDTAPGDKQDKIAEILMFPGRYHKFNQNVFLHYPKGKDAEFYHDLVKKERPPQPPPQPQPGQGQGKDASKPSPSSGGKAEAGGQTRAETGSGNVDIPTPLPDYSAPGRGDLPQSFGDVLPHPLIEEGDEEKVEQAVEEWKQKVARGINNARQQGSLPGWIEEIANTIYGQQSKQNWRAILRRWMTRVVSFGGQSYDRPNRRLAWLKGIIIPANRSRQASKGAALNDTSGSMGQQQCDLALSEMEAVLRTFIRCEIDLFMADTRLIDRFKKTFRRSDFPLKVPVNWLGRGGTNLAPAITQIAKDRSYKWLVVISDMEWHVNLATNPKIPVIWIWTPRPGITKLQPHQRPTFGLLIGPVVTETK